MYHPDQSRAIPLSVCLLAATAAIVVAGTKFTSTWKAPEAARLVRARECRGPRGDAPPYNSPWGYDGYGWGTLYDPGFVRDDTVVVIETLIYSVPMDKLLWASVTESTNPKNAAKLLAEVVKETAKQMQKQGLTRASAR